MRTGAWEATGPGGITPKDFGIAQEDIFALDEGQSSGSEDEGEEEDGLDPIVGERRRKVKQKEMLRRRAGEPEKPVVVECLKLGEGFLGGLREVLA